MRILFASTLFFLIGCNNAEQKEDVQVAGAWKMLWEHLKSEKTDTTFTSIQQLKIFTGDHMMYANVNPADSVSGFGVATYSSSADTVTENVFFTAADTSKDETAHTYKLAIERTVKGYKQNIPDIVNPMTGEHFKLTEEYETAGTDAKTPLDGLWKLEKATSIKVRIPPLSNTHNTKLIMPAM